MEVRLRLLISLLQGMLLGKGHLLPHWQDLMDIDTLMHCQFFPKGKSSPSLQIGKKDPLLLQSIIGKLILIHQCDAFL